MKAKVGYCVDCPEGSGPVALIAKRCQAHYWKSRNKMSAAKPKHKEKLVAKKIVGVFFANQTLVKPECCEECDAVLPKYPPWRVKATIAHILAKRPDFGFPSVAIHPMNKIFLCIDCHTNMDNLGDRFVLKMKMLPVMRERVAVLLPFLTEVESGRVPEWLIS